MVIPGQLKPTIAGEIPSLITYSRIRYLTHKLPCLSGFRDNMTLTSLRRGDAYVLDQHLKFRETARTLMGQRTEARAFFNVPFEDIRY